MVGWLANHFWFLTLGTLALNPGVECLNYEIEWVKDWITLQPELSHKPGPTADLYAIN